MSLRTRLALITCLLVALPLTAEAQVTLKLADGTALTGKAKSYDAATQTLEFVADGGREMQIGLDELDGRSSYLVNRSNARPDHADTELQLGNFARDVGLYAHSARHYKHARRLDPELRHEVDRQTVILNREAAESCMAMAEEALSEGDRREAEQWLTKLIKRWPDEELRGRAVTMLDTLYDQVHGARDDDLEAEAPDLLATDLRKGKQYYDRMLEENEKGLLAPNQNQARSAFNKALREGERALGQLDRVAKKRTDAASQETLQGYRELVNDQIIETRIHYASQLMVQSDYKGALRQVNAALAIDSKDKQALAMRSRIENAISRGIGWW